MRSIIANLTQEGVHENQYTPGHFYKLHPFVEEIDLTWSCFNDDPHKDLFILLAQYFKKLRGQYDSSNTTPTSSPIKKYKRDANADK